VTPIDFSSEDVCRGCVHRKSTRLAVSERYIYWGVQLSKRVVESFKADFTVK